MGLSINTFDLLALIESLQNLISNEPETPINDFLNASMPTEIKVEDAIQIISDSLNTNENAVKTALENISQAIANSETTNLNNLLLPTNSELPESDVPVSNPTNLPISAPPNPAPLTDSPTSSAIGIQVSPIIVPSTNKLDEATRRMIEEIARSLQISVVHSYQSTDIIDEGFSQTNLANSAKANSVRKNENSDQTIKEEKRRADRKNEEMREELKRARFKNSGKV